MPASSLQSYRPAKLDCPPSTKVWLIISSTSCHLSKVSFPNPLAPGRCLSVGEPHCLSTTDIFAVVVCFLFCFVCFFWPSIHACVTLWLAYIWGFADPALLSVLPELKMVEAAYQASGYCPHVTVLVFTCLWEFCFLTKNIAKGTTDPRVKFISQDLNSQFKNLEHITISEYRLSIKIKISTRHKHLD